MRDKRFTTENESNGMLYVDITYPGEVVVTIHKSDYEYLPGKKIQSLGMDLGTKIDIQTAAADDEPYLASEDM